MRLPAFAALLTVTLRGAAAGREAENQGTVATSRADAARSGHYVLPGLTWANAADVRQDAASDERVPGNIYAQPLYRRPAGAVGGYVIAATETPVRGNLELLSNPWTPQLSRAPSINV
jgi:hypothetical protein